MNDISTAMKNANEAYLAFVDVKPENHSSAARRTTLLSDPPRYRVVAILPLRIVRRRTVQDDLMAPPLRPSQAWNRSAFVCSKSAEYSRVATVFELCHSGLSLVRVSACTKTTAAAVCVNSRSTAVHLSSATSDRCALHAT